MLTTVNPTLDFTEFRAEHLLGMELQPAQRYMLPWLVEENLRGLETPWAYTVTIDGCPVACAGISPVWGCRAVAWSYLSPAAGPVLRRLTKAALHALESCPWDRVEITVDLDHVAGHRWARLLGFHLEAARMAKCGVAGQDQSLYARVR